jgi:hypothetical protein
MLIIFFDIKGAEFVPAGQTVNSAYYCDVLRLLPENVQRFRPELWRQKNWLLHKDKAPSHTFFYTMEFFPKNSINVVSSQPIFICFSD